jgi:hypothetical protein
MQVAIDRSHHPPPVEVLEVVDWFEPSFGGFPVQVALTFGKIAVSSGPLQ